MSAGSRDIADEATAEAFARLFDHRDSVRDPLSWLYRTAFRIATAELKRRDRLTTLGSPEQAAPDSILSSEMTAALVGLSPAQRIVVFLHYYAGLSIREIASLSGSPSATVKVRLHRARRALRERLEQHGAASA